METKKKKTQARASCVRGVEKGGGVEGREMSAASFTVGEGWSQENKASE